MIGRCEEGNSIRKYPMKKRVQLLKKRHKQNIIRKLPISLLDTISMSNCARPGCINEGINKCSLCLREHYCSGECQKGDWKIHKNICKSLEKLSLHLQPYHKVVEVIEEISLEEIPTEIQQYRSKSTRAFRELRRISVR
jgi:hypothetical protein